MRLRYLLWQWAGLILVLSIFAIFSAPVFSLYLRYSIWAILLSLALAQFVPQSYRRYFGARSAFWDVTIPISIALICAAFRVMGKELHLEYLLPIRIGLSLVHGKIEKREFNTPDR